MLNNLCSPSEGSRENSSKKHIPQNLVQTYCFTMDAAKEYVDAVELLDKLTDQNPSGEITQKKAQASKRFANYRKNKTTLAE